MRIFNRIQILNQSVQRQLRYAGARDARGHDLIVHRTGQTVRRHTLQKRLAFAAELNGDFTVIQIFKQVVPLEYGVVYGIGIQFIGRELDVAERIFLGRGQDDQLELLQIAFAEMVEQLLSHADRAVNGNC